MTLRAVLAFLTVSICIASGCGGKKKTGIAELTSAAGPVEREQGSAAWVGASIGAQFYIGDSVRTADGAAELLLARTQPISMTPHTVLRFESGKDNSANLTVG